MLIVSDAEEEGVFVWEHPLYKETLFASVTKSSTLMEEVAPSRNVDHVRIDNI